MTSPRAFRFATATEIRFGRGESARAVPDLAALGASALLVIGGTPSRSDWLAQALEDQDVQVTKFAVQGEPDVALVEAGVRAARAAKVASVIALGGGAVIDAGKAIAALTPTMRPMSDHLEVVGKGLPLGQAPLPFAALPTTSGTGAEVTRNAVIAVPDAARKVSLRDPAMLPRLAIVDPALTDGCPRAVTLASGLDAITQVIEPYICTRANPMTDALCRDAIPRGLRALVALMNGEDRDARDEMSWASLSGGLALANAGLGVIHGLAGPLGGLSSAAHGAICGALLPFGLAANAARLSDNEAAHRIGEIRNWIADALGSTEADAFAALAAWSRDQGLLGLDAQGVTADHRAQAAKDAATSSSMRANPVSLTEADLAQIMEQAR
ncbi:iron-containing alcohol dehydrogenase [Primorskyibacter sp. 2E233]|uniref:iron-containing alcohol dehydrogenase n=1 Tax=Primorskyibacter sp. 2E233 TaxID=3413431 RepID=UPI003BF33940